MRESTIKDTHHIRVQLQSSSSSSNQAAATLAWEDTDDPWLEDAVEMSGMGFNLAYVVASTT